MGDDLSLEAGIFWCWEDTSDIGQCEQSQQACLKNSRPYSYGAKV